MKKLILSAAAAAILISAAGCGSDGVTFKANNMRGIKIVAPEEGWSINQDEDNSFAISRDRDTISFTKGDAVPEFDMPENKEELTELLNGVYTAREFSYEQGSDGSKTIEYVTELANSPESGSVTIIKSTISAGHVYTSIASTPYGNDERVEQLKTVLDNNITEK